MDIKKGHLTKTRTNWTKEELDFLKLNYDWLLFREIGDILGKTEKAIRRKCQYLKLKTRKVYSVNQTFFDTWSHNMAYLLGFIVADGCVKCIPEKSKWALEISIAPVDRELLEFANSLLCPDMTIYEWTGKDGFDTVMTRYSGEYLVDRLIMLDIIPRKTGHEKIPEELPDEYFTAFLRGLIDGDGWFSFRNNKYHSPEIGICSQSKLILDQVQQKTGIGYIEETSQYNEPGKYKKEFWRWTVRKNKDVEYLCTTLLKTPCFSLTRKRKKMEQWLSLYAA